MLDVPTDDGDDGGGTTRPAARYTVAVLSEGHNAPDLPAAWVADPTHRLVVGKTRSLKLRGETDTWHYVVSPTVEFHLIGVNLSTTRKVAEKQLEILAVCDEVLVAIPLMVGSTATSTISILLHAAARALVVGCEVTLGVVTGFRKEAQFLQEKVDNTVTAAHKGQLSAALWKHVVDRAVAVTASRVAVAQQGGHGGPQDGPLRMVKVQRFTRLNVTHAKVVQGTLKVGMQVSAACDIRTTNASNQVDSMRTYPNGAIITDATPGMHVSFKLKSDNVQQKVLRDDKNVEKTFFFLPTFSVIGTAESAMNLCTLTLFLVIEIPVPSGVSVQKDGDTSDDAAIHDLAVRMGVCLDGFGGRSIGYVISRTVSECNRSVRLSVVLDFQKNSIVADCLTRLKSTCDNTTDSWHYPIAVTRVGGRHTVIGRTVAMFNSLALHKKAYQYNVVDKPITKREDLPNLTSQFHSFLSGIATLTHPIFSGIQDGAPRALADRIRRWVMMEVSRDVSDAEYLFFLSVSKVQARSDSSTNPVFFLHMVAGDATAHAAAVSCVSLKLVCSSSFRLSLADVRSLVHILCNRSNKLKTATAWLNEVEKHPEQHRYRSAESILFEAICKTEDPQGIMTVIEGVPDRVDYATLKTILTSSGFPNYIVFFTLQKTSICRSFSVCDFMRDYNSSDVPKQVKAYIKVLLGRCYIAVNETKLLTLSLHAAAMRYFLLHVFSCPRPRFPYSLISRIYECLQLEPL